MSQSYPVLEFSDIEDVLSASGRWSEEVISAPANGDQARFGMSADVTVIVSAPDWYNRVMSIQWDIQRLQVPRTNS